MYDIHLICNAHIDPVWMWTWEEGAAEALSTFRVAADFCEQNDGFIFNHNEAILYKWVEEYDPKLFERIKKLVQQKKWHIMGGWYLQPDCNMPSGESFVRQILEGRKYFLEKFGVKPTTAINFDSFGHTRGLVQIMKKAGYDSYIFCRPEDSNCQLPADDFIWIGYDGSELVCHRGFNSYESHRGKVDQKIRRWLDKYKGKRVGLVLWGIGNHGGGPSKVDYQKIKELSASLQDYRLIDSTPEAYFDALRKDTPDLPKFDKSLNPQSVGCYTSQNRIKKKHRLLENELYMVEKMSSAASIRDLMEYPKKEIQEAINDLMFLEFHDILPGSSIQAVEEDALRLADHALEIISRLKTKTFFALSRNQRRAEEGEIPILAYNPFPFKVKGIFECEFQLADQNWSKQFSFPIVYKNGERVPCQVEHEASNFNIDWRKRSVFYAELEPSSMNRFDCKIEMLPKKPEYTLKAENGRIVFTTKELEVVINCETGLIDKYAVNGYNFLAENSFRALVMSDSENSWGNDTLSYKNVEGCFRLMSREESTEFSGISEGLIDSVRIIEDGEVRTVVEALFRYNNSFICQRYKLPKYGTEIEVDVKVYWNEKMKMLKLSMPTTLKDPKYIGQVAYGVEDLTNNERELVAQKWTAVISESQDVAFTCINDGVYGSDFNYGEMRMSLVRSPGYSAGCSDFYIRDPKIMPQDRFSFYIDQGERDFCFWLNGGKLKERIEEVDREALVHNEKPFVLSFFPSGDGAEEKPLILLEDDVVVMTAFKKCEKSDDYIIRLFEPTGTARSTKVSIPLYEINQEVKLNGFEIKTLKLDIVGKKLVETDLMEGIG
ncbi:MAG TPA: alpha-mannosidase [Clostridiaceae bacterium]|nr:alpha-mannosidase [Clostridiaceae bacterium]